MAFPFAGQDDTYKLVRVKLHVWKWLRQSLQWNVNTRVRCDRNNNNVTAPQCQHGIPGGDWVGNKCSDLICRGTAREGKRTPSRLDRAKHKKLVGITAPINVKKCPRWHTIYLCGKVKHIDVQNRHASSRGLHETARLTDRAILYALQEAKSTVKKHGRNQCNVSRKFQPEE